MATQTLPMALPNQGVVATNVIDTIKVNMQLSKQPVQQRTVVSNLLITASTIISDEGVTGLYRGLGVVMGGIVPKMAIRFTSYECYKQMLTNKDSLQISRQGTFIAGLAAGVTEAVSVVNPVEVVKIRLQAQNAQLRVSPQIPTSLKQQNSTLHTVVTIMRVEGISSLYRGVVLTALRQGTNQAANFTVYNELKMLLTQDRDSRMLHKHRNSTNTSTTSEIPPYQTTIIGLIAGAVERRYKRLGNTDSFSDPDPDPDSDSDTLDIRTQLGVQIGKAEDKFMMTSSEIPSTRTALVKTVAGQAVITKQPMPALKPGYMLVQTKAVALNPADASDIDYAGDATLPLPAGISPSQSRYEGCIPGIDYAGIVVQVMPRLETNASENHHTAYLKSFNPGDRVCGLAYGCNALSPDQGAFADYIVVSTDLQMHMPEHMSFEEAASLGVGVLAAGMGLFRVSKLGIPSNIWNTISDDTVRSKADEDNSVDNPEWILVYGGSTATGSIAIQFAKLAGYKVVTTCSPHNFELVKRVGADAVFDYKNAEISSLIRTVTSDTLHFVFDAVATDETAAICVNSLASTNKGFKFESPALYISLLDPKLPEVAPVAVEKRFFLGYSCWGSDYYFAGMVLPAVLEDYWFAVEITSLAEILLAKGKLRNHPISVNENVSKQGGLQGVLLGLDLLRNGVVSGRKLVYSM
ncbi:hypothetical protein UA08_08792 [Talaromyces atroroseus]|uniref:Enoyl reductase (ER) domain-containing protein n=1 Tax=Talaromyces atroroseus TaxID=1441469 RepID=A0A225A816_TALAT|nr:hypothetical protein UA08_08792 [Talaromyces atroroseus]OKL56000.1 hypothetical protein UA08_08792 [Talaromyces atroroseus]